jgi:hypothetical protein
MRHNKKRNSALLYEFLIRHISKCLINDDKEEANKAMILSKKYFVKGTVLHDELKLFNSLLSTKVKNRDSAQKIVNVVLGEGMKLNARKLDAEKSGLIKEINHTLKNEEFYNYKIPHYTVYASIHSLLGDMRNKKKLLSPVERVKIEDNIVEHLVTENVNGPMAQIKTDPNYNNAVYKFVVERFHKKYNNKLTENQKKFLTKYAVYLISENKGVMQSAVQKEVENIKVKLKSIKDESVTRDTDLMNKLNECYKSLVVTNFENITEDNVLKLLQYMRLLEEIDS